jgi:hypothetical protein
MTAPICGTARRDAEDREQLMSRRTVVALLFSALLVVVPARAGAATTSPTGGMSYSSSPSPTHAKASQEPAPAPVPNATVGADGLAIAPAGAPPQVVALIAAGNQIASLPYKYGGGHGDFADTAYDCSGSVSFALHGAALLDTTLDSTGLTRWGVAGPGAWITVYGNKTHAYLVVAGLRFDTSGAKAAGTRWQAAPRSAKSFRIRHPLGL